MVCFIFTIVDLDSSNLNSPDNTFVTNFFLTYRRFASPRSVLLAMQKRMRQLDGPNHDPMFVCYAQMR